MHLLTEMRMPSHLIKVYRKQWSVMEIIMGFWV